MENLIIQHIKQMIEKDILKMKNEQKGNEILMLRSPNDKDSNEYWGKENLHLTLIIGYADDLLKRINDIK